MGCQCVKKRITYSCLHQEARLEKCWRDAWKHEFPCLGVLVPRCDSPVRALHKQRFGFCAKCAAHFGLPKRPSRYDKKYVERYLDYKKDRGLAEQRIKATYIPLSAVYDRVDGECPPLNRQSPMRPRRKSTTRQTLKKTRTASGSRARLSSENSFSSQVLNSRTAPKVFSTFPLSDDEEKDKSDHGPNELGDEVYELESMSPTGQNQCSTQHDQVSTPTTRHSSVSMDVTDASRALTMLSLYHDDVGVVTTEFDIELDEFESVVIHRTVPKLNLPSSQEQQDRHHRKGRKFYQSGLRSLQSPSGFATQVKTARRHSLVSIPCPPPPVVGKVFTGRCNEHQSCEGGGDGRPRTGCQTCQSGGCYLEAGVPTQEDLEIRRHARSAPPILVRCQVPASRFECAVQTCFCDLVGDKCLTCREREKQADLLGAAFF